MPVRTPIRDFELANPLYKNAVVAFFTVASGVKTSTLANLYSGPSAVAQLPNPQKLNSQGQFKQAVYIQDQVIGSVTGISVPGHDTAIHSPSPIFRVEQSTGEFQYSYDGGLTYSDSGDSIFFNRGNWATGSAYRRNDMVAVSGTTYICLVAHMSGVFATDLAADKWQPFGIQEDNLLIPAFRFGIVADGTDQTTELIAALASGENIVLPRGIIGIDGDAAITFPYAQQGQKLIGAGTTDVANYPARGTVLKRLTGTGPMLTVATYTEGIEIAGFCFDQNGLGGEAIKTGMHSSYLHDLVVHNQAVTYGVLGTGMNLSTAERIRFTGTCYGGWKFDDTAGVGYGALNSEFNKIVMGQATAALSAYGLSIEKSTTLTFNDYLIQGGKGVSLSNGIECITFNQMRAELDGQFELLVADGTVGGIVRLSLNDARVTQTGTSAGAKAFLDLKTVRGFKMNGFRAADEVSAAGRPYVKMDGLTGASFRDITLTNSSGNAHKFLSCSGTRSDQTVMENADVTSGTVTCDMKTSGLDYRNTNIPITFNAASQLTMVRQSSGTVDTTNNSNGIILEGQIGPVTDASFSASRVGFAGVVSAMPTKIASTAALPLTHLSTDPTGNEYTITGVAAITSITAATSIPGRFVTLHFEDILTFTDGNNLILAGNFVTSAGDTITLSCNEAGKWEEKSRSAN